MSVQVRMNPIAQILAVRGLENEGPAQQFIGNEVRRRCDKYVPFRDGPLKNTAQVVNGGKEVHYIQPYARAQYYSARRFGSDTGPLRGPKWFERMKSAEINEVRNSIARMTGAGR